MNLRVRRLLDLARDQVCQNCGVQNGTTVAAHSNLMEHGKGKSIKAADVFSAWLCFDCHSWLDQGRGLDPTHVYTDSRADKREMFVHAMHRTWLALWEQGLIRVNEPGKGTSCSFPQQTRSCAGRIA